MRSVLLFAVFLVIRPSPSVCERQRLCLVLVSVSATHTCALLWICFVFLRNCTLSKTPFGPCLEDQKKNSQTCVAFVVGLLRAKALVWLRTVRLYKADPGLQACLVSFVRLVWLPCCSPPTDSQCTQIIQRI